jgi:hypothetical protein
MVAQAVACVDLAGIEPSPSGPPGTRGNPPPGGPVAQVRAPAPAERPRGDLGSLGLAPGPRGNLARGDRSPRFETRHPPGERGRGISVPSGWPLALQVGGRVVPLGSPLALVGVHLPRGTDRPSSRPGPPGEDFRELGGDW